MKTKITRFFLMFAGITGIYIGASLLFTPVSFEASAGIPVTDNVNLLSEIRSSGGTLLAAGMLILIGGFRIAMTRTALIVSSLFYSAYGISRVISILIDGLPNISLVLITASELVIGMLSILLLLNFQRDEK
jgi:hypothetical protein